MQSCPKAFTLFWVFVKVFSKLYSKKETLLFTTYPHYGNCKSLPRRIARDRSSMRSMREATLRRCSTLLRWTRNIRPTLGSRRTLNPKPCKPETLNWKPETKEETRLIDSLRCFGYKFPYLGNGQVDGNRFLVPYGRLCCNFTTVLCVTPFCCGTSIPGRCLVAVSAKSVRQCGDYVVCFNDHFIPCEEIQMENM